MAKELRYTITGDARDFTRALRSVNKQLAATETRSHQFGRGMAAAFGGVGHAATVAGAAIGAGVVLEATRSVKAFQESNKVARQTQAVLKSTGGVANVTAQHVSNLATQLSRKTGIDDEVVQSGENMLLTFRNIRDEAGKGNDIFSQSTKVLLDMSTALGVDSSKAAIQLGKALNDPVKGITALRRVGVTFTDSQQEQIATLVESGKKLQAQRVILGELKKEFGGSAEAQATSTEKMRVAFGNLEEDIGSGLAPAVDAIAGKLTDFAINVEPRVIHAADQIAKTFGRKDLSLDQKFRLSYDQARKVFKPLIDEARASIGKMHLGDRLNDAITAAIPKIADALAENAPKAAARFVHAFTEAGPWGQLLIGGFLLKKLGGLGAFFSLGKRAGGAMGAGVAAGAATRGAGAGAGAGVVGAGAAGGIASRLPRSLATVGGAAAGLAAVKISSDFIRGYAKAESAVKVFQDRVHKLVASGDRQGLRQLSGEIRHYADANEGAYSDSGKAVRKYADDVEHALERGGDAMKRSRGDLGAMSRDLRGNWNLMAHRTKVSMKDISDNVRSNIGLVKQRLGDDTDAGRKAVAKNFRLAAQAIKTQMHAGTFTTREGTTEIRKLLVQGLTALGLNRAQAVAKLEHGTLQSSSDRAPGGGAGARGAAAGMYLGRRGERGMDNVPLVLNGQPVMAARGEFAAVWNRHQQQVMDRALEATYGTDLQGMFDSVRTPHYMARGGPVKRAARGIVGVPGFPGELAASSVIPMIELIAHRFGLTLTDAYGQGHQSPGHTKYGTAADFAGPDRRMDAAVKFLTSRGYTVGYDGRFGSQRWPGHGPSYVAGSNAHLHAELGGRGAVPAMVTPRIRGPRVRGAGGPAALADRALQVMAGAANQRIRGVANNLMMSPSPVAGGGAGGWSKPRLKSLWVRAGGDPGVANLMAAIALAESGGRSGVVNSIGATGLWQIHPGGSQYLNPLTNARTAVMKLRTQGLRAWETYTNGSYRQYMARGGIIGRAARGLQVTGQRSQPSSRSWTLSRVNKVLKRVRRDLSGFDVQDTDTRNRLLIQGLDPDSGNGLGFMRAVERQHLLTMRRDKGLLQEAFRHAPEELKPRVRGAINDLGHRILQQRADISQMVDTSSIDAPSVDAGPSDDDVYGALLSIAQSNDTTDPRSLADNLMVLKQQQKIHQQRYGYAAGLAAQGNTSALVVAGQEAETLSQLKTSITDLTDTMNATKTAIEQQRADLATELRRQNDINQAVYGSQTATILKGIAELFNTEVGGSVGRGAQTPRWAGSRVRW